MKALFLLASFFWSGALPATSPPLGEAALSLTGELVKLGPRPPGSAGIEKARQWIRRQAKKSGGEVVADSFAASTPLGKIEMENLSVRIPGKARSKKVLLVAHYDTKKLENISFVGANDAASSVALLLALLPEVQKKHFSFDVEIHFVDGEEALVRWEGEDCVYGSRRLAGKLGDPKSVLAVIVVDMVGDKNLELIDNPLSSPNLRKTLMEALKALGKEDLLARRSTPVEDDHVPFLDRGFPTLHLMDFTYGGDQTPGSYWHTAEDTVDKLSAQSLDVVGRLTLEVLSRLGSR